MSRSCGLGVESQNSATTAAMGVDSAYIIYVYVL